MLAKESGEISMTAIFNHWPANGSAQFGRRPLVLKHALADSPLFSDQALARLIEATPRENYHVNTMPPGAEDPHTWREGDMSGLSGEEVMEAVAKGRLWVHLQRVQDVDKRYRSMLNSAFEELARRVPGFHTYRRSMSILISSPRMNVAYHADVPGQSLWQISGRKRVWIYPACPPFLPQRAIEDIVLKRSLDTDLPYARAFDDAAESFVLEAGDMATWPRNCPHRVVNDDCVNVSFTTEHWTDEFRAGYAVDYANGLMRPLVGDARLSRETRGFGFFAKFALAGGHKLLVGLARGRTLPLKVDFRVNGNHAGGFENIPPRTLAK